MNRFSKEKKKKSVSGLVLPIVLFVFACGALIWGAGSLSNATESDAAALEQSIARAAVHCYALEGFYPPSIEYLQKHYALSFREDKYVVDYRCFAQNLMPDITVLPLGGAPDA